MLERPEINQLKDKGYTWDQPFDIVRLFENKLSVYTGAPYVTVTDCCTHAIELCLRYEKPTAKLQLPKHTYLSLPMTLKKLNLQFEFIDNDWTGYYYLAPTKIVDMAARLDKGCYIKNTHSCLSFGHKKVLEILRGGAILTDNKEAHQYFQTARYDGRDINNVPWTKQKEYNIGYHYNLSIEDCARGILLLDQITNITYNKDLFTDCKSYYPDLSKIKINYEYNR